MRQNRDKIVFESIHVAAFKMVINFDKRGADFDTNLWSIDTGMNGNPFQGHYFDMNNDHIYGRLAKMKVGRQLEGTPVNTLIMRPESRRKVNQGNKRRNGK